MTKEEMERWKNIMKKVQNEDIQVMELKMTPLRRLHRHIPSKCQ
jgi:hypothetical protein